MNKTQRRQMVRGEAFNSIMRIYHHKAKFSYDKYNREQSYAEQRDSEVSYIIEKYFKEIEKINKDEKTTS